MTATKKYPVKLLAAIIVLITIAVYYNSLNNQFVDLWDDGVYITNNPKIKSLNGDSISYTLKNIFSSFHNGHYHPITNLTYATEYSVFGLNPKPYHVFNLLLHIINALLVFAFIRFLSLNLYVAFVVALLFSVHPMHVESVAWISDRKDLLCCTFFLASIISYLKYLNHKKKSQYAITFLLFILALMSKALAVTLPFVFFAIDYYKGIKFSGKTIKPKIPFLALSLLFGYISIIAQKSADALGDFTHHSLFEKIMFSSYSLVMYIVKLFSFGGLSAFYNFPINTNGMYPTMFYFMPFVLMVIIWMLFKLKRYKRQVLFGCSFFVITIAMVLQIVPAGSVIMADRYTYIPYIGLFFVIAFIMNEFTANEQLKQKLPKQIVYLFGFIYLIFCCYYSYSRTKIWNNSMTLWSDTIEKNPDAAIPYCNRGSLYYKEKEFDKSIIDFTKAIKINPIYTKAYFNRGLSFLQTKNYTGAVSDFDFVLQNKPVSLVDVYLNRGQAYVYLKEYKNAYDDFSKAIQTNINCEPAYYYRGMVLQSVGRLKEAINDFSFVIQVNPRFAKARFLRAVVLYQTGNFKAALEDIIAAKKMGYPVDPRMLADLESKLKMN